MRNKKYVTHRSKGLVNLLPPPLQKTPKFSEYMDIIPIKMLTLKILGFWKIQFTNTLLIALL